MSFGVLALIALVGLAGPLLVLPRRLHLPVVLGELVAGVLLGPSVFHQLHAEDPTFSFLADIGFALVMYVAGTHVPVRDPQVRGALLTGVVRAAAVGVLATALGFGAGQLFDAPHAALYAVLMASSSAALVLPIVGSLGLTGPPVLGLLAQVAVADAACIVALPLVIDPGHAGRAALGAMAVISAAVVVFLVLRKLEANGIRKRVHRVSEDRKLALELRINLVILFSLAYLARETHVSIMLAGFSFGLVISAIGSPRRLTKQLFALTEGFLGPLFFVWLGASLDLRDLGSQPRFIGLGLVLGLGAVLAHTALRLAGQPLAMGGLAASQLGVPVAAATLGTQQGLLAPGESSAFMLGALITIAWATASGAYAARTLSPT